MDELLTVPPTASLFILLQRTAYQSRLLSMLLRRAPGRFPLQVAQLEAALRRGPIASRFTRGILRDFRSIKPFLPHSARAILDVGCGLAAVDVLLGRHYSAQGPVQLYLADYNETSSVIRYGFGPEHSRYSSFSVAEELLLSNGIPADTLHFMPPEAIHWPRDLPRLQLVISTLAWGFHFPVETYAETISEALAEDGRVILDVRVGTSGVDRLGTYFPIVEVIEESDVRTRVMARK